MAGEKTMERKTILLGGFGFILLPILMISLPFFCVGAWEGAEVWQDSQTFITTEGEVIHNTLITSQDSQDPTLESSTYHPVVRFTTTAGETKTFTAGGGSYPAKYEIGETVTVMYNPADPSEAQIKSWELWFVPTLFMVIGLLPPLVFGGFILFLRVMRGKQAGQQRA